MHLQPDPRRLAIWAARHRLLNRSGDLGYAFHGLLQAAFGDGAPGVYRYLDTDQGLLGYTGMQREELMQAAALAPPETFRVAGVLKVSVVPPEMVVAPSSKVSPATLPTAPLSVIAEAPVVLLPAENTAILFPPATEFHVFVADVPALLVDQSAVRVASQVPEAVVPALEPAVVELVSQYTVVCAYAVPESTNAAASASIRSLTRSSSARAEARNSPTANPSRRAKRIVVANMLGAAGLDQLANRKGGPLVYVVTESHEYR
jgi:hypothetical protein